MANKALPAQIGVHVSLALHERLWALYTKLPDRSFAAVVRRCIIVGLSTLEKELTHKSVVDIVTMSNEENDDEEKRT